MSSEACKELILARAEVLEAVAESYARAGGGRRPRGSKEDLLILVQSLLFASGQLREVLRQIKEVEDDLDGFGEGPAEEPA